ncbi:MAG TPA: flagellar protein FlaG [Rhodocyclaceae bacterium]|nr:flagellar protein FlaG [Rhodocyclaceae bacterium]
MSIGNVGSVGGMGGLSHLGARPGVGQPGQSAPALPSQASEMLSENSAAVATPVKVVSKEVSLATSDQSVEAKSDIAEAMQRATDDLRRRVSAVAPELNFSVDEESGRSIIKIVDPATKEVIRQIPSEEALQMSKGINSLQGLLLRQTA